MSRHDEDSYTVTLHCGHSWYSRVSPPRTGDEVWCAKCAEYRIVKYRSSDWRVKCVDCRYSRYLGGDQRWAVNRASEHVRKMSGHRVKVFQANKPDEWELIQTKQSKLPLTVVDEVIPY